MATYGKSPFKTVAPRKKTLRIAKKIISDPDSLTENEKKIGNNLLKRLKKQRRTLANYIKFEGKAPPSPPAPKRKPTRPSIAARSRARVKAQKDIDKAKSEKQDQTVDREIAFGPKTEDTSPAVVTTTSTPVKKPLPSPKRKPTPPSRHAEEFVGTGPKGVVAPKHILKDEPKVKKAKKDVREKYPTKGTRRALKPLEGGVRYVNLPDWLGGGRIKIDTSDKAFDYENPDNVTHGKKGGQVKKGVKKTKAKARKRAALRGHRAELRGG